MHDTASPFGDAALELCLHGLAVLPVGGHDGKKPLVTWQKWRRAPREDVVRKHMSRFSTANVGIICGLSNVTVVDVDDPALVAEMIQRCGETPLQTATPSGVVHLWYRHDGEPCVNLRSLDGLPVDVKGAGGFVVVPPSVRPTGSFARRRYEFLVGSWDNLGRLPKTRANALMRPSTKLVPLHAVAEGRRNDMLFKTLLRNAPHCDTEADLLDVARTLNDNHNGPPLPDGEVAKTAASAWRYESEQKNCVGKEARAVIGKSDLNVLSANPDALTLWLHLNIYHGARTEPFAVSPKAIAKAEVIPGWRDHRRYAKSRDEDNGFLNVVHAGGTRPGDAWLFRICAPPRAAGGMIRTQYNETPSPG